MRSETKDYYAILGVTEGASSSDIKQRYRALSKRFHPDANGGGDIKRMALINEAYAVLSDPIKRFNYQRPVNKVQDYAVTDEPLVHFTAPTSGPAYVEHPAGTYGGFNWKRVALFGVAAPVLGVLIAIAGPAIAQIIPQQGIFAAKPQSQGNDVINHPMPTASSSDDNNRDVAVTQPSNTSYQQKSTGSTTLTPVTRVKKHPQSPPTTQPDTTDNLLNYYSQLLSGTYYGMYHRNNYRN